MLKAKTGALPDLVHAHPSDTVRDVIQIMTKYDVDQLPILNAEPPVVMGEVAGAIDARGLMELVFSGKAALTDFVRSFIGDPLPLIGIHEGVSDAWRALGSSAALLVSDGGKPAGVITRHDLLSFVTE